MIYVLAGITPRNMHLARSQIDHQCSDRALTVHGIDASYIMVADRVRQIDVVLLNGLQRLDGMRIGLT